MSNHLYEGLAHFLQECLRGWPCNGGVLNYTKDTVFCVYHVLNHNVFFYVNIMIQDMINSENSMNTTESTNTNMFKIRKDGGPVVIWLFCTFNRDSLHA